MIDEELQGTPDPQWLHTLRQKARQYDKMVPKLQRDLAVLRANVDDCNPAFDIWAESYGRRVREGEAEWSPEQVAEDARKYV